MTDMSERMTDAEFERNASGERPHPSDEQGMVDEARRARSEEARLLKESADHKDRIEWLEKGVGEWRRACAEKDATIAVLTIERDTARKVRDAKHAQLTEKDAIIMALADALAGRLP